MRGGQRGGGWQPVATIPRKTPTTIRFLGSVSYPLVGRVQLRRHHRAGVQIHRVLGLVGQVRGAVLHLGDLGLRGRSWKPSPGSRASCPCACGPGARSSAVGVSIPLSWAKRSSIPGNPRPCPSAQCCAAPRWPPWSRHPPRCARPSPDPPRRSAPGPSQTPPVDFMGQARAGPMTARNGPAPVPASPTARNSRSDRESEQRHSSHLRVDPCPRKWVAARPHGQTRGG